MNPEDEELYSEGLVTLGNEVAALRDHPCPTQDTFDQVRQSLDWLESFHIRASTQGE